jgi:hypothetical protein
MSNTAHIQYRVAKGKKEEIVDGPDDADVVLSIASGDIEMGANVAFMRGKLKATGHTGVLLRALATGEIDDALSAIASRL